MANEEQLSNLEVSETLSPGYKLVPWSTWSQWLSVHSSIFSPSPTSALHKIAGWRSRGSVPVPVDITAAIVEIQQKDPFFRGGVVEGVLESEELLAMLYCMAVMRLVNGFVEPVHKKTGRSISALAEDVGIPRMVVDIRHESSHRNLPSLRLARMAGMQALDWLKWNYWDPQKNAIPDVKKEMRTRLKQLTHHLKTKHTQKTRSSEIKGKSAASSVILKGSKLSSQVIGKIQSRKSDDSEKQISKIYKIIARLYSSYPSEVVLVLLEFFYFLAPDDTNNIKFEQNGELEGELKDGEQTSDTGSTYYFKTIVAKLCSTRPKLLLSILKAVLEIIEVKKSEIHESSELHLFSSPNAIDMSYIKNLCNLVSWLLMKLKMLKDSGKIRLDVENQQTSTDRYVVPKVSLTELLNKCLQLSVLGNKHMSYSVLLITELIGARRLSEKLNKLSLLRHDDPDSESNSVSDHSGNMVYEDEASIRQAEEKLKLLKSHLGSRHIKRVSPVDDGSWTLAKSWAPCPIGTVPCSFTSTAVLPVLDIAPEGIEIKETEAELEKVDVCCASEMTEPTYDEYAIENGSPLKKLKQTIEEEQILNFPETVTPMTGYLCIGGVRQQLSEEELLSMEANILKFMSSTVEHLRYVNPV